MSLVEDRNLQWAQRMGLLPSQEVADRLSRSRLGEGACYVYSFAALPDLIVCAGWITWLLVVDDQNGEGLHSGPAEWAAARAPLERIVDSKGTIGPGDAEVPARRALADLCRRTFPYMSNAWHARFAASVRDMFDGYHQESIQRLAGIPATPEEYVAFRRRSGSVPYCIAVSEFAARSEVPDRVYRAPEFQDLLLAANDIICWSNDVFSAAKERARGDVSNYLAALVHHDGLTWEQAHTTVIDRITGRANDFLAKERELDLLLTDLDIPPEECDAVWANTAGMRDWMSGEVAWMKISDRYRTFEEVSETNPQPPSYVPDLLIAGSSQERSH
ncbi:hypothetical protein P2Q00_36060 [Streptomyces coacervatus]|uniref:terpene synthase family protein n=1 Tax=Streptomyces coacervatus TaxID=647381 RepID=UPI0023DA5AA6|nr:hypothetical protein [Streptomyces coacervatus]MDF2270806.1 hypothetical protein [Streptomyces coacervatus]